MAHFAEFLRLKVVKILQWLLVIMGGNKQPRPLYIPPEQWQSCKSHPGIAIVMCSPAAHNRVARRLQPRKPAPPATVFSQSNLWSSSISGDIIGSESGVHMEVSPAPVEEVRVPLPKYPMENRMHVAKKTDIPPCISILPGYVGILPTIFENEELANGEYLEAIRKNGVLHLTQIHVCKWLAGVKPDEDDGDMTFVMD